MSTLSRYHDALMTAISAAILAADLRGSKAETWTPPAEDSSDDSEDDEDGFEDEDSSDDEEDDSSDDDESMLVPRLSPVSDEL